MSPQKFTELYNLVAPDITKKSTNMREAISAKQRLAVGRIIFETCQAIWNRLYEAGGMTTPNTEEQWVQIADEFEYHWNFPNCLGAIDGKHINMLASPNAGSAYYNYKGRHSIVLMAVCDAKYQFIMVEIGQCGRQSDGSVYNNGDNGYAIENNTLNIPNDRKISNNERVLPFVFVGDDALGLKRHMMKPYPFTRLGVEKHFV